MRRSGLGRDAGKAARPAPPAAAQMYPPQTGYTVFAFPGRVMNFVRKAPKR